MAKDDKSKKPAKKSPKDTDQADLDALEEVMEDDVVVVDDVVEDLDEVQVVEEDVVVVAEEDEAPARGKKPANKATMLAKVDEIEEETAPKRADKKTKLGGAKPVTTLARADEDDEEPAPKRPDKKTKLAAAKPETEGEEEVLLVEEDSGVQVDDELTELDIAPEPGTSDVNLGEKWSKDKPNLLSGLELDEDSKASGRRMAAADENAAAALLAERPDSASGDSSSVELGSTPMVQMPPSGSREDALHVDGDSEAELAGMDSDSKLPADSEVVVGADGDEEDLGKKKSAKKPSRALAWMGGTVFGVIVGAAACVGLVYFDVVELNELLGTLGKPAKTAAGLGATKTQGADTTPARPPREIALNHKALGNFDKALEELEKAGDGAQDKKLVTERAEARLLAHLQKHKEAAKHTDEQVKKVTDELKAAEPGEGLFLHGLAMESTGQRSQALALYQDGLKQAKDARAQRIFQAAVDRLESRSDDRPAGVKPEDSKPAEKE